MYILIDNFMCQVIDIFVTFLYTRYIYSGAHFQTVVWMATGHNAMPENSRPRTFSTAQGHGQECSRPGQGQGQTRPRPRPHCWDQIKTSDITYLLQSITVNIMIKVSKRNSHHLCNHFYYLLLQWNYSPTIHFQ